jgi:serine/threonine protein kinase/tetratricopeptide (TPR) repeat protein
MNKELTTNTTLSHYRIVSKIGAGGMGEVYLAQDTKLDRKVAIKFLHEEFSKDADKLSRFMQEAKAASALNHPNILTVYEIGEVDGKNYIATELIDGRTLREHLLHKESLQLNSILKIGVQVSEALSAAHQAGIIHRDIKPENIMLREDGYVKVLDFGLAKLTETKRGEAETRRHGDGEAGRDEDESNTLIAASPRRPIPASRTVNTTPGMVMGTASYMSPEQARGKETDARTDIWSLGVVLYEMLSGKVPFTGETTSHTLVSILEKEPLLLENVPAELQRIVRKAMTKDVDMRYQSARDLLIDLKNLRRDLDIQGELERSVGPNRSAGTESAKENQTQVYAAGAVAATRSGQAATTQNVTASSSSLEYAVSQARSHKLPSAIIALVLVGVILAVAYFAFVSRSGSTMQISSIAVLPFENKSGNADSDYLSDGVAESLIYKLSQLPNLRVSPRSSVFRYKGKEIDAEKIGAELGVDAVMSGRIIQRGDNLTISVDLVDVRNKKSLWGEQYERKMSDLLATQREIASAITEKLQLKLSGEAEQKLEKRSTDNNEAYQLFLKAQYLYDQRTKDSLLQSIEAYKEAIKLDPRYARAYVGIARSYTVMPSYTFQSPNEAMPKAIAAAKQALQIDPNLAEAHGALANILALYDWNWAESEREFKRALELDPNVAEIHNRYSRAFLTPLGRFDESAAEIKRALELEPLSIPIGANASTFYLRARKYDLALEQAQKTSALDPNHPAVRAWLGNAYNASGMYAEAIAHGENILQTNPTDQDALVIVGFAYAKTGRSNDARAVIDRFNNIGKSQFVSHYYLAIIYGALGEKDKALAELEKALDDRDRGCNEMNVDLFMDPIRDDPRFRELLKRLNLPG